MPQLIVRNIESALVKKLKETAVKDGVSMEEEHRRILRKSLLGSTTSQGLTFIDYLKTMPEIDPTCLIRQKASPRKIDL